MSNAWAPQSSNGANSWFAQDGPFAVPVEASLDVEYSVHVATSNTFVALWDARNAVAADLAVEFNVDQATVEQLYSAEYDLGGWVSRSFTPAYEMAGVASNTLAVQWGISREVSADFSPSWKLHTDVWRTLTPAYSVTGSVDADLSPEWSLVDVDFVVADLEVEWDLELGTVSVDFAPAWRIHTAVEKDFAPAWNLDLHLTANRWFARFKDGANTWQSISGIAVASFEARWSVHNAVTKDFEAFWPVGEIGIIDGGGVLPERVVADFSSEWFLDSVAMRDLEPVYSLLAAPVTADLEPEWKVVHSVQRELAPVWAVQSIDATWVANNLVAAWSIVHEVSADLAIEWDLLDTVEADMSPEWQMDGPVWADLSPEWGIGDSVHADFSPLWKVLGAAERIQQVIWGIAQAYELSYDYEQSAHRFEVPADAWEFVVDSESWVFQVQAEGD